MELILQTGLRVQSKSTCLGACIQDNRAFICNPCRHISGINLSGVVLGHVYIKILSSKLSLDSRQRFGTDFPTDAQPTWLD